VRSARRSLSNVGALYADGASTISTSGSRMSARATSTRQRITVESVSIGLECNADEIPKEAVSDAKRP